MSCCPSCCELCCPCLVSSKKKHSSKYAYIQYTPIKKSEGPPTKASKTPENIPAPPLEQVFEFPQKKTEILEHPQMFIGSSPMHSDVVTQQPMQFRSLPGNVDLMVRSRTKSLPQNVLVRKKPKSSLRAQSLSWARTQSLKIESAENSLVSRAARSLPDLRTNKSLLKRRKSVVTDMVTGTDYSSWIPELPVLEEESLTQDSSRSLIQFSLQYDLQKCCLTVHLHHACNLPAKDRRGTSDPFVVLYMMPNKEEIFESKIVLQSLDPVFDESFEFRKLTADDIRRQSLTLRVYDHDKFSKNDTIGGVILPLEHADLFGVVMRMAIDEDPNLFSEHSRGDLLLALSYDLTLSCLKGVLLKATNLKKQDVIGLADPYVKIRLYYKDRLLEKWKSSIKRKTLVPVYNESFQFDIPGKDIKDIVLEALVMDYDRLSKDDVVGKIMFGSKVGGELELRHWQEMISGSPQVISQWHAIKQP